MPTESGWEISKLLRLVENALPKIDLVDWWSNPQPGQSLKQHDTHEILYVIGGTGHFQIGETLHSIGKNDVLLIKSGVKHGYRRISKFECIEFRFHLQGFDIPDRAHAAAEGLPLRVGDPLHQFLASDLPSINRVPLSDGHELMSRILGLHNEYRSVNPGREPLLSLYFMEFLILLSRLAVTSSRPDERERVSSPRDKKIVASIIETIENDFQSDRKISEIVRSYSFHPDYVRWMFKRETGMSISRFLADRRMTEARKLLIESSMPLKAVVSAVGLDDYFYFLKAFKRYFGLSPTELRRRASTDTIPLRR